MALTPEEFIAKLRAMPSLVRQMDCRDAMESAAGGVYESVGRNFTRQVDETGKSWPPRKDKLPHPLLRLTLAMSTAATGGPGAVKIVESRRLKLSIDSSKVHYWKKHQDGEGNVPRRRYFFLHADERGLVLKLVGDGCKAAFVKQVLSG